MKKRLISIILVASALLNIGNPAFAATDSQQIETVGGYTYTYNSNLGRSTSFNLENTDRPYNNIAIYDNQITTGTKLGLPNVDVANIGDMREASNYKKTTPSVDELAQLSGDIINVNAADVLYGMEEVVNHLNTKQITISDMEAIMWSFIFSQFATPYESNLLDVLNSAIFRQMIEQGIEISGVPDSTTATVMYKEVFKPDTKVADKVKIAEVSKVIKNNLAYRALYKQDGISRANLFDFLTADMGSVFYVKDWETGFQGKSNIDVWNNRRNLVETYGSAVVENREKLVPVYVQSNVGMIQNQINLGSFLKGQASSLSDAIGDDASLGVKASTGSTASAGTNSGASGGNVAQTQASLPGTTGDPSFSNIVGSYSSDGYQAANGTMGNCQMYIDSFGNICVYHENKMKIVLCNAQNSIFNSRPDDDDEVEGQKIRTINGSTIDFSTMPNVLDLDMSFTRKLASSVASEDETLEGSSSDGEKKSSSNLSGYSRLKKLYTDDEDVFKVKTNEVLPVYSKPVLNVYTQSLQTGEWNSDQSIHFIGDTPRESYPGFLNFHRTQQNSHREQLVFFKAPSFNLPIDVEEDSLRNHEDILVPLIWASATQESIMFEGLNLKTELIVNSSGFWENVVNALKGALNWILSLGGGGVQNTESKGYPTQQYILFTGSNSWLKNWNKLNADGDMTVKYTSVVMLFNNVIGYVNGKGARSLWYGALESSEEKSNGKNTALALDMMNIYNHMMMAGMGFDKDKMIPGTLISDYGDEVMDSRNFTVGGCLIPTLDYGQWWDIVNSDTHNTTLNNTELGGLWVDPTVYGIYRGLMLPFNRIEWTFKQSEYNALLQILGDFLGERSAYHGESSFNSTNKDIIWNSSSYSCPYKRDGCKCEDYANSYTKFMSSDSKFSGTGYGASHHINGHMHDIFTDSIYLQLRDLRVSDSWVTFGKEEISIIAFTWLNYYLPKGLYARTFIDGTYEDSEMAQAFMANFNKGVVDDSNKDAADEMASGSVGSVNRQTGMSYLDGTVREWDDSQIILGPYLELHGEKAKDRVMYNLYPDTSPLPASVTYKVWVGEGKPYEEHVSNHVEINTYDLIMSLYRNTNTEANNISGTMRGVEVAVIDKNEILLGLSKFLSNPASTLVSMVTSVLQSIHRSLARGSFSSFFQAGWLSDTEVWATVFQYYFIIVMSLVVIASLYLFFNLLLDRSVGLFTTFRKLSLSVVLTVIPVVLINFLITGLDKINKAQLDQIMDKASVAETATLIVGTSNSNADFEYSYQLFREQFDAIEDVLGKYGYQIPLSYYQSTKQFRYKNVNWQDIINSVAWTSNQNSPKWYDYRVFTPVNRAKYSSDLFYYFYDYIKWQYLQYTANAPLDSSIKIQRQSQEYVYGTSLDNQADYSDLLSGAADPSDTITESNEVRNFITGLEKLMLTARGNFAVMMNDPNYIYGESFLELKNKQYGGYYLEDLFGLGYLLTDVKDGSVNPIEGGNATVEINASTWEVSDELYCYPGWVRFREHPQLAGRTIKKSDGSAEFAFGNQAVVVNSYDKALQHGLMNDNISRNGRVYGSQLPLYSTIGYNRGVHSISYTPLEKTLFDLNQRIYDRITDMIRYFPSDTPDEAYIELAALIASFEFTKEFGRGSIIDTPLEPYGFKTDSVTYDSILKGLFAQDVNSMLTSRELMYMLVDNAGGFGIAACFIIVIADVFAFIVMITRNVLITLIFAVSVLLCIFYYLVKKDVKNRVLLGVVTQCIGLFGSTFLTTLGIRMLVYYSVGGVQIWKDILIAMLLALMFFADAAIHVMMLVVIFKDFSGFGGNIIAKKLSDLKAKLTGRFQGQSKYKNADFENVTYGKESEDADDQDGILNDGYAYNAIERLETRAQKLRKQQSQNAQNSDGDADFDTDGRNKEVDAFSAGCVAAGVLAAGAASGGVIRSRNQGSHIRRSKEMPNVAENNYSGIRCISDNRFESEAEVTNPDVLDRSVDLALRLKMARESGEADTNNRNIDSVKIMQDKFEQQAKLLNEKFVTEKVAGNVSEGQPMSLYSTEASSISMNSQVDALNKVDDEESKQVSGDALQSAKNEHEALSGFVIKSREDFLRPREVELRRQEILNSAMFGKQEGDSSSRSGGKFKVYRNDGDRIIATERKVNGQGGSDLKKVVIDDFESLPDEVKRRILDEVGSFD